MVSIIADIDVEWAFCERAKTFAIASMVAWLVSCPELASLAAHTEYIMRAATRMGKLVIILAIFLFVSYC